MVQTLPLLAFLGPIGTPELVIIAIVALLIFGRRLPDVARSVGKSIVEFKKGIRDVKDDINIHTNMDASPQPKLTPPTPQPHASGTSNNIEQSSH